MGKGKPIFHGWYIVLAGLFCYGLGISPAYYSWGFFAPEVMEELRRADQRKDEFLAMLAHELRNPMAAISMALSMLDQVEGDPVKSRRYRETARRQMGHLVRLVFGIQAALVPDIPLVEGQVDVLLVLSLSADGISGGDAGADGALFFGAVITDDPRGHR